MARRPLAITNEQRAAAARRLEPYDAERSAAITRTALVDVAIGGRGVAVASPVLDRHLTPRQLAARERARDMRKSFIS